MTKKLLTVANLSIQADQAAAPIVRDLSFSLAPGETLVIVGQSGAGKSMTLKALAGLLPAGFQAQGSISLSGKELLGPKAAKLVRGHEILYMSQQAMTAFDPLVRIGTQLAETLRTREKNLSAAAVREKLLEVLSSLRFADPASVLERFPCELSGGMLQRCMTAAALLLEPQVILADEPTSALDVLSIHRVLEELERTRDATGAALIVVTHDLNVARRLADSVLVMKDGRCLEQGSREILDHPQTDYARHLEQTQAKMVWALEEATQGKALQAMRDECTLPALVTASNLSKNYLRGGSWWRPQRQQVLADIDFSLYPGEVTGLVGGSGEGKSTLSRLLLGMENPDGGEIRIENQPLQSWRSQNPGGISAVFQNYADAADPRWSVEESIAEPLREALHPQSFPQAQDRALELLSEVGLPQAKARSLPHELSGGELQRVSIARALAARPKLVVFDEALSSLDASIQGEILELLKKLRRPDSSWLFISHDLKLVASICTRVLFLSKGRIVESLPVDRLGEARSQTAQELLAAAF